MKQTMLGALLSITVSLAAFDQSAHAQIPSPADAESIANFNASVLSVSEFKNRFNANINDPMARRSDIASLFSPDLKTPRYDLERFIGQVSGSQSVSIKKTELTTNSLLAKVNYEGVYKGSSCTLRLLLRKRVANGKVWWELADGWAPFMDSLFTKGGTAFIPPHAEDLNFAMLTTDRPGNDRQFSSYLPDGFRPDALSVINTLVRTGQLKLKHASHIQLYVDEFRDWILMIEKDTSGWKITDLQASSETARMLSLKYRTP